MPSWTDDYTRSRAIGVVPYAINDKIGRPDDKLDKAKITVMTVSGTADLLPIAPLGRRSFIKITNTGGVDVAILTSSGMAAIDGFVVDANGGTWEDYTNATFYVVSTGADSTVQVYERASR